MIEIIQIPLTLKGMFMERVKAIKCEYSIGPRERCREPVASVSLEGGDPEVGVASVSLERAGQKPGGWQLRGRFKPEGAKRS